MSSSPKVWLAPAKINLFLHINNKRKDGYHNLQTLFQLLDYHDELQFTVTDQALLIEPQVMKILHQNAI